MNVAADNIGALLLEHNIKPSYPRIRIMQYLSEKKNHPTVEEIHGELVKEIPTLSKTTIYNTLKLFVDARIARVVTTEENEARYDAELSSHGHFKCESCGEIYDFFISPEDISSNDLNRYIIYERSIYCKGICPKCIGRREKHTEN